MSCASLDSSLRGKDRGFYRALPTLFISYCVFMGLLMHHYFVDQFIWRPSKDKNVRDDLKLGKQHG